MASDMRGLRDVTLWQTNDGGAVNFHMVRQARPCREVPAVLGITVAEIEKLRQDALSAWLDRAAAERERDQARAEAEELRTVGQAKLDRAWAECDDARAEAAALRNLVDAAARRIALTEASGTPSEATAGEAFAAVGVPSGDMLGDREWLREYRAARALRGGDG